MKFIGTTGEKSRDTLFNGLERELTQRSPLEAIRHKYLILYLLSGSSLHWCEVPHRRMLAQASFLLQESISISPAVFLWRPRQVVFSFCFPPFVCTILEMKLGQSLHLDLEVLLKSYLGATPCPKRGLSAWVLRQGPPQLHAHHLGHTSGRTETETPLSGQHKAAAGLRVKASGPSVPTAEDHGTEGGGRYLYPAKE